MKIKSTFLVLGAMLLAGISHAQDGWNWPTDPAQEAKAREFNAAYFDYMKAEQFVEATKPLSWLLVNAPNLNESIYIQGVTVYKGAADKTADAAQKRVYQDSVMALYEKRGELYNNPAKWIETKAYYGYLFFKSDKAKIPAVVADFDKAIALKGSINFQFVPMYFDLDGNFPNHEANPIEAKNLKDLQKRVKKEKADIGLAFDGDADRCFLIDELGGLVNPSALTALIAVRELKANPGASIIYNLISSKTVPEVIAENGGIGVRSRVGHSYIKSLMAESGAIFGGEHSGHFYFSNFWRADSGMLAALYALTELMATKNTLSELLKPFNRYVASGEINSKVKNAEKSIELIRKKYCDKYLVDDLDGLTITADNWWFNLRPSNTEPLLRLNVEADTEKEMVKIRDTVLSLI